ncbi:DUF1972 domain-containing protein [Methylobacterium sp. sgz302541]|uniref:DUF1972 domain-containing protein n=1 Tax=unclassified Methylobacterium TaxID=2615210 RepID=UPI003D34B42B
MSEAKPTVLILGTRGIPASHGGFETFAEKLALHLAGRGWNVGVYCQKDVEAVGQRISSSRWNGIELITIEVVDRGPVSTLEFDWLCTADAAKRDGVCLVLGYNGAIFLPWLRLAGRPILTNMDGIEWKRPKWSMPVRAWFWLNEWIAAWSSHRLVADHPAIADHLATRRPRRAIVTIPYGGDPVGTPDPALVEAMGLTPDRYLISIARIEPDNNILSFVEAFSRKPRGMTLVVLGELALNRPYHRKVKDAASDEVIFPGAIYDSALVKALRYHARAYCHGHTVGGTNPSLVESLWAGNAVIAHDNAFNRGTAGEGQLYFSDVATCEAHIASVIDGEAVVAGAREAARAQALRFDWPSILGRYESEIRALGGHSPAIAADPEMGRLSGGVPTRIG